MMQDFESVFNGAVCGIVDEGGRYSKSVASDMLSG